MLGSSLDYGTVSANLYTATNSIESAVGSIAPILRRGRVAVTAGTDLVGALLFEAPHVAMNHLATIPFMTILLKFPFFN